MNKKRTVALVAAAVVVCAISSGLYIMGHQGHKAGDPALAGAAPTTLQFPVTQEDLVSTVEVKGKSSYQKETRVYAPFGGEIRKWNVSEGAQVKQGDLLFELDDTPLRSDISELQTSIRKQSLEAELSRFRASGDAPDSAGVGTGVSETDARQRFANAEERRIQEELGAVNSEAAQLSLHQKQEKIAQAAFKAPEDGIFLFEDSAKIPQLVQDNERIGKIVDLTKLQLVCTVGELDVFRIKPDMAVDVKVDALKQTKLRGKVEKVSKFAKSGTDQGTGAAQFEVTISLEPNEQLIAGLSLSGTIETDKRTAVIVVPTLAVQREKDVYFVMVQTPQGAERRDIEIGLETPEKTEVLQGLKEGETVVLQ